MSSDPAPSHEHAYLSGQRDLLLRWLRQILAELGEEERTAHSWKIERQEAVSALRAVCTLYGDNDWEEDLHLADVIDKHLFRHLDDGA